MLYRGVRRLFWPWNGPSLALCRSIHKGRDIRQQLDELAVDREQSPVVILFPGQGSQFVGMAQSLIHIPEAKQLFDRASEILKYDLAELCNKGPIEQLAKTAYCQPALLVTSLAALHLLKSFRPDYVDKCVGTAGFSLGEITSLVFAEAIPFDQAVKLVQVRAEAMQKCCEKIRGGMVAVVLRDDGTSELDTACERAKRWCIDDCAIEAAECAVANHLYPNCKVIAGNEEALQYLRMNASTYNLWKVVTIAASGAFHTTLMQAAVQPVCDALNSIRVSKPSLPVYSNVTAAPYEHEADIRTTLPQQIVRPVLWQQTMQNLYASQPDDVCPATFVCGPGLTLLKNLRRIDERAWRQAIKVGD